MESEDEIMFEEACQFLEKLGIHPTQELLDSIINQIKENLDNA